MPYYIKKLTDGYYRVIRKHDKVVIARHTTKEKAQAQIRLLQSIEHPYKKNPKKKNKK